MTVNANIKSLAFLVFMKIIFSFNSCAVASVDTIYFGGPIITMIKDNHRVESLAVKDGVILATGSKKEMMGLKGKKTKLVDLKGHALMPGFIDPHSRVVMQSAKFANYSRHIFLIFIK